MTDLSSYRVSSPTKINRATYNGLVTAVEAAINAVGTGSGPVDVVTDRAALAAVNPTAKPVVFLREAGRDGVFEWDSGNNSALVTADTRQGLAVAPSSDTTGASGAWLRRYDGDVWLHWFGALADYNGTTGTDNYAAIIGALAALLAKTGVSHAPYEVSSAKLRVASGKYYVGQQVEIRQTLVIEGDGVGFAGPRNCEFFFPPTGCGFIIQRSNVSGGSGSGTTPAQNAADGAIIRGVAVNFTGTAPATPADDAEFHGFLLRARGGIEDCQVSNARGDGVKVEADSLGENANGAEIRRFKAYNCRNAVKIIGADANVVRTEHVDGIFCRRFTIWDESFLGCYHGSPQALANGVPYAGYGVNYNTQSYAVVIGMEEAARTNAPSGTSADNDWWSWVANGEQTAWTAWTSGMARVEASGGFYLSGAGGNSGSVLDFGYSENSQGPTICNTPAEIRGGVAATRVRGTGLVTQSTGGSFGASGLRANDQAGGLGYATISFNNGALRYLYSPDGVVSYTDQILADSSGNVDLKGIVTARGNNGYIGFASRDTGEIWVAYNSAGVLNFWRGGVKVTMTDAGVIDTVGSYRVSGTQVVGAQGAAVADAAALTSVDGTNAAAAPTQAEFNALVAEFNKLRTDLGSTRTALNNALSRLRAHGLIAT